MTDGHPTDKTHEVAVSAKPIAETSLCSCLFIGYLQYPDTLPQGVSYSASQHIYDPPNEVGGSLCFCLVRPASVCPGGGGGKKNMVQKHVLRGFEYVSGVF